MDFTVVNHFTLYTLTPHTPAARRWVKRHLPPEITVFGNSIAVEHRYIGDIMNGIRDDGLSVGTEGN